MMIGLICFDFYLLYEIKNEQIFKVDSVAVKNPNPIKESLLKSITDSFHQKEEKTNSIKSVPLIYKDPSI